MNKMPIKKGRGGARPNTGGARPGAGAPSKYTPAHCQKLIDIMSQGHSPSGAAGSLGITRNTLFKWARQFPAFEQAMEIGRMQAAKYWEDHAKRVARTGEGNAAIIIFALKNRGADDWRDKIQTEVTGPNGAPIQIERVERIIIDADYKDITPSPAAA